MPGIYTERFRRRLAAERGRVEAAVRADIRLDPEYRGLAERAGAEAAEAMIDEVMDGYYRRSSFGRIVSGPLFALAVATRTSDALLQGFLDGRAEERGGALRGAAPAKGNQQGQEKR